MLKEGMIEKRNYPSNLHFKIPCIYMAYTKYMHGICHTYTRRSDLSFLTAFKAAINVGWTVKTCTLHGISGQLLDSTQKAWFIVRQDIHGISMVYTMYIPCIFMQWSLASPLSCPAALGSLRPGLPSELFSFGHREVAHTRLGPSKVPQPGVDLVNMAAPPWGWASTIGTAALKSVLLSAAVLMRNSWGCISVQKAWNEWNSAEEVLNPPDVESGNRWGLVYPVNSFRFHEASSL